MKKKNLGSISISHLPSFYKLYSVDAMIWVANVKSSPFMKRVLIPFWLVQLAFVLCFFRVYIWLVTIIDKYENSGDDEGEYDNYGIPVYDPLYLSHPLSNLMQSRIPIDSRLSHRSHASLSGNILVLLRQAKANELLCRSVYPDLYLVRHASGPGHQRSRSHLGGRGSRCYQVYCLGGHEICRDIYSLVVSLGAYYSLGLPSQDRLEHGLASAQRSIKTANLIPSPPPALPSLPPSSMPA